MDEFDLYTPQELIDKFPHLLDMGWSATKLGILFTMGILKGRRVNKQALITLRSFSKFVDYYNKLNQTNIPPN